MPFIRMQIKEDLFSNVVLKVPQIYVSTPEETKACSTINPWGKKKSLYCGFMCSTISMPKDSDFSCDLQ